MMKTKTSFDLSGLDRLQKISPEMWNFALQRASIQMLTWMNTGSPRESRTPPLRSGVLRGSGVAYVGDKMVSKTPFKAGGESGDKPAPPPSSPLRNPIKAAWYYNTDYAAKMHEWDGGWGLYTKQSNDGGKKWMEAHMKADRQAFVDMIQLDTTKWLDKGGRGE